jgi:phage shock protein E
MAPLRHAKRAIGLGIILLLLIGCTAQPTAGPQTSSRRISVEGGSYTPVNPAELATMLKQKTFSLVNVHIPYEGEIAATDAFIPYDQIQNHLAQLPADKNARIVLYCRSGRMSEIAARTLVKLGYQDVWDLQGGMIAWEAAGNTLLQKAR